MTGSEFINSNGLDRHDYGERVHDEIVIPRLQCGEALEDIWDDLDTAQKWCFNEFVTNRARHAKLFLQGPCKPFLGEVAV